MRPHKYKVELTEQKGKNLRKYFLNERIVYQIARRFVEEGMESILECKKQLNRHYKIMGDAKVQMLAITCSDSSE